MITITQQPYNGPAYDPASYSYWDLWDYFSHSILTIGAFLVGLFAVCVPLSGLMWITGAKPGGLMANVGLIIAILAGLAVMVRNIPNLWFETELKYHRELLAQDHRAKVLDSVCISGISGAWDIDDLEDFGPGYVVETQDGEYAIVMTQFLGEFLNDDGQPQSFPSESIVIDQFPLSKDFTDMRPSGKLVPIRGSVSHSALIRYLPPGADSFCEFHQLDPNVRAMLIANE